MRIRMRIDGTLYQDVLIPKSMQSPVIARLKIMANLDVTEQRLPQDGRAAVSAGRREINLRVSSLPTAHGENVVLRILDSAAQGVTLPALGLGAREYELFQEAVHRPHGVVAGHRPDRQWQDHDALRRPEGSHFLRGEHIHARGTRSSTACRSFARPRSRRRSD